MREFGSNAGSFLRNFFKAEDGLVTVEWVALAGALVIGAITVGWIMMNGLQTPATNVDNAISSCATTAAGTQGNTKGCTIP